jgi:transposase
MLSPSISDETEQKVCTDYIAGMNSEEVARKYGISKSSVGNILKRSGVVTRKPSERHVERDQAIVEYYLQGASQQAIADQFGLSQSGVGKILERHHVTARFRLTAEQKDRAVALYSTGLTSRQIAKQLGVNFTAICSLLRKRGVTLRSKRKWCFDEKFFTRTDDRVSYWMGFFMADGNIIQNGNTWQFTLAVNEKDKCLLEHLCNDINLSTDLLKIHQRTTQKGNPQTLVWFRLYHQSLQDWFLRWGIVPRKSYNFVEPTISVEAYPGFLRGWLDGDGCLYIRKETSTIDLRIAGNKEGMVWYAQALRSLGFRGKTKVRLQETKLGSTHYLIISGERDVSDVYSLLNCQDGLRLERKWCGLEEIIERRKLKDQDEQTRHQEIVAAFKQGRPERDIARDFDIGTKRVRGILLTAGFNVKRRRSPTRVSTEVEEAIITDYKNNLKQHEIAAIRGLTQARVSTILAKHNVATIPSHIRRMTESNTAQAIAAAYLSGKSQAEIAQDINKSISCVHKVLKRRNVPMRPARRYRRKNR